MRARAAVGQAFQYGLIIFTLTALLGIANATQIFGPLDRDTLLAHLYSGAVGWITMSVIGIAIWMFAREDDDLFAPVMLSALTMAAYVMAFWSGVFILQAVFALAALAVILYWWWFVYIRVQAQGGVSRLEISKLSFVFGLTTLLVGSLGVIVQLLFATGSSSPTDSGSLSGQAAAVTGGYFVLVAAGFAEWQLTGSAKRTTLGLAQVYLLFVGALLLAASLILDAVVAQTMGPLVPVLATLLIVAGTAILVFRVGQAAIAAPWMAKTGTRHIAIAVGFLALAAVLQAVVTQQLIAAQGDVSQVSTGLLHALDHAYFVGAMTNLIFGAILVTSSDGGSTLSKIPARPRVWPWADDIIFWGLNVGAAALIAVLLTTGSGEGKGAFIHPVSFVAPIMGLAALLGTATYLVRLMGLPAAISRRARA